MFEDSILLVRKYNEIDKQKYVMIPIAWPVRVLECAASKKRCNQLNCLQEALLKFIAHGVRADGEIAQLLQISEDLVQKLKSELFENGFIDDKYEKLTEQGNGYLKKNNKKEFSDTDSIYGHMFMSLFDGDVMPYFLKGQLPLRSNVSFECIKLFAENSSSYQINVESNQFSRVLIKAYKESINAEEFSRRNRQTNEHESLKILSQDVHYENVDDNSQVKTLADVEQEKIIDNAKVILLNKQGQDLYVKAWLVMDKKNPDDMQLVSPFPDNVTIWYNKKFVTLAQQANNIQYFAEGGKESFAEFIEGKRQGIIVNMPNIEHFNYFLDGFYPSLNTSGELYKKIGPALEEYYAYYSEDNGGTGVIGVGARLIETLLNIFVGQIRDRKPIVRTEIFSDINSHSNNKKKDIRKDNEDVVERIFLKFGIKKCRSQRSGITFIHKMRHRQYGWDKTQIVGSSIEARIFFLVLEAFLKGESSFKSVLENEAQKFMDAIDDIYDMRNNLSSHNASESYEIATQEQLEKFNADVLYVTGKMIHVLVEEENKNVKT